LEYKLPPKKGHEDALYQIDAKEGCSCDEIDGDEELQ
jgi:hypothetical protein